MEQKTIGSIFIPTKDYMVPSCKSKRKADDIPEIRTRMIGRGGPRTPATGSLG
jgi:hypothetical protein